MTRSTRLALALTAAIGVVVGVVGVVTGRNLLAVIGFGPAVGAIVQLVWWRRLSA